MNEINKSYESILKEKSSKKTSVFSMKKTYPAYIILIIFLILSYFIFEQTKSMVDYNLKQEFGKATSSVIGRLEAKKQRKLEIINSVSTLFDIFPFKVPKDYFELYSTVPTLTYPDILGVMYAPKVQEEEYDRFIYNTQSMGYYDYQIKPKGNRDVYYPTEYIVPFENNVHQHGLDFYSIPELKIAIDKAVENNFLVTSPVKKYRGNDTLSFYMISPIYESDSDLNSVSARQENIEATVILEIMADKYFENALASMRGIDANVGLASDSSIYFRIIDIDYDNQENIIYHSENSSFFDDELFMPLIEEVIDYQLADRTIKIEFATVPGFGGKFQSLLPIITLVISLIISFGFFGFILSLITSRARAQDLAERMTRSQRRIVETSNDMISILDFEGNWKSMNPASINILNYSPDEMIGSSINQYIKNEKDKEEFFNIIRNAKDDVHNKFDMQMLSKEQEIKWISWSLTISKSDAAVYALGRDVTVEKIAEQQALLRSKQIQLAERMAQEASESKSLFMIKLSHQLRNNLTGIIGYLQLLSNKVYETEEELNSYVQMAEESSEEIFTFVSDIVEATINTNDNQKIDSVRIEIGKLFDKLTKELTNNYKEDMMIKFNLNEDSKKVNVFTDENLLMEALLLLSQAISLNRDGSVIEIAAQENAYEKITEIQILGSKNKLADEMIKLYKDSDNYIDMLNNDKEDIIFNLASAASIIRRLNGSFIIDTFGSEEGSVIMINLPFNK